MGAASRWHLEVVAADVALWEDRSLDRHGKLEHGGCRGCRSGWLATVDGKVWRRARLFVQGLSRVDPSAARLHWPIRLTLFASHLRQAVLARRKPRSFPIESQIAPRHAAETF